ncbi:uncharacterized protein LOC120568513 [Perca fluviatilis]|uniref:uncharacterized protein LOC120568513 n=1 Tax=Perca fluviatilis TaxID=8168 RepID=UPI00196459D1|nr:uncharacterized protein LOC120568513 [Perca fluviatilis]
MLLYLFLLFSPFIALGSMNSIKPESTEEHVAEGRNINLTCTYEGTIYSIHWYRQYQRSRPEFLLYITFSVSFEELTPVQKEENSLEDSSVTLSYKYLEMSLGDYFLWYRQYPGKPPEFIISHSASGQEGNNNNVIPGLKIKVEDKQIHMTIPSAKLSDSAVLESLYLSSVTERSENPELRGDGETQGGTELLLNYRRERNFYIQQRSIHKPSTLPLFNMLSLQHCLFPLLCLSILTGVRCEELTPVEKEENSFEDSSFTLSYRYSKQADNNDYFFWYRQYPGKPPEFIIFISGMNITKKAESLILDTRFSATLSEEKHRVDLQISSAAVTDSALYYCAVDGNNSPKFILSRVQRDEGNTADEFRERFSSTHNSKLRSVPLKIQKLQLSDYAVYSEAHSDR